jgi:hypothetical protein
MLHPTFVAWIDAWERLHATRIEHSALYDELKRQHYRYGHMCPYLGKLSDSVYAAAVILAIEESRLAKADRIRSDFEEQKLKRSCGII